MEDERLEVEKRVCAVREEGSGKKSPFNNFSFTSKTKFYETFYKCNNYNIWCIVFSMFTIRSSYFRGYTIYNL